jgi:hypothetical protein
MCMITRMIAITLKFNIFSLVKDSFFIAAPDLLIPFGQSKFIKWPSFTINSEVLGENLILCGLKVYIWYDYSRLNVTKTATFIVSVF